MTHESRTRVSGVSIIDRRATVSRASRVPRAVSSPVPPLVRRDGFFRRRCARVLRRARRRRERRDRRGRAHARAHDARAETRGGIGRGVSRPRPAVHARARRERGRDAVVQRVPPAVRRRRRRRDGGPARGRVREQPGRAQPPERHLHGGRAEARRADGRHRHRRRAGLPPGPGPRHRRVRGRQAGDAPPHERAVRDQDHRHRARADRGGGGGHEPGRDRGGDSADDERQHDGERGEGVRLLPRQEPRVRRHGAPGGRRAPGGPHDPRRVRRAAGGAVRLRAPEGPREHPREEHHASRRQAGESHLRREGFRRRTLPLVASNRGLRPGEEDEDRARAARGAVRHPGVRRAGGDRRPEVHPRGGLLGRGGGDVRDALRGAPVRPRRSTEQLQAHREGEVPRAERSPDPGLPGPHGRAPVRGQGEASHRRGGARAPLDPAPRGGNRRRGEAARGRRVGAEHQERSRGGAGGARGGEGARERPEGEGDQKGRASHTRGGAREGGVSDQGGDVRGGGGGRGRARRARRRARRGGVRRGDGRSDRGGQQGGGGRRVASG